MTVGVLKLYKSKPYDLRQETGGDCYANTIKLEAARRNHSAPNCDTRLNHDALSLMLRLINSGAD